MRWPAARITAPDQRATTRLLLFAGAELVLAMAIPFLLIRGYHTLASSNAGTFVDAPTIEEPGWSALVAATPLTIVVEVVDGAVSGATLIVGPDRGGAPIESADTPSGAGTIVLIPGDLSVPPESAETDRSKPSPSTALSDLAPSAAGGTVAEMLNVEADIVVMDADAWARTLSGVAYRIDNPDPVPAGPGQEAADDAADSGVPPRFAVGPVEVDGAGAAVFLGRPIAGAPLSSVMPRRRLLWEALVARPPSDGDGLASLIGSLSGDTGATQVLDLPTVEESGAVIVDDRRTEELIRDIVAFPSGSRLEVRVVDRTGDTDLAAVAAGLAGRGIEVVEIANAVRFDGGSTELIRPAGGLDDGAAQLAELAAELGLRPLLDEEPDDDRVTLLVGADFSLGD